MNLYEFLHKSNLAHPLDFCKNDIDLGFESRRNVYINPSSYTTFIQADLSAKDTIRTIFNSFDIYAVLHFAAFAYVGESVQDPCKYYRNNIANTINLLEIMRECGCKNIIFSSTCATYGNPLHLPIMESHPQNPINPYGYSKLVVEQILRDFSLAYNFRYVILRYFNAAGASMLFNIGESHNPETHVIPLVIQTALQKRDFFSVFGNDYPTRDGTCIRDYIHVDDLASAHVLALKYLQNGGDSNIFNLGNGDGFSVFEILDCVERITNNQIPHKIEQRREGDPAILIGDSTRAREILHWNPQFFELEHIIQSAFKWHSNARY
ncbi:UDP-glucose 4-epimerase GalE [Helicobacter muridarum]|uniref:UDP-glucose 4-epimerase n=1 Tax=Helicobacter muridarum TaxID=216 RepID=A0A4U8TJ62_9HELI|nr:UDP-glucose 4-epimerase GalE [Helicobacter muridarum]TLE00352.1 UDP-glucose 4-epimerase GalE [Helicobacter muridarum]